jgi:hypothetical protein
VYHPACEQAHQLATQLFRWFRLGDMKGDTAGAGLPVYYRRRLRVQDNSHSIHPEIGWHKADVNVVIALVDHRMVGDEAWREAIIELADLAQKKRKASQHQALLLPVALHESFFRTGPLYEHFNPVQLLGMTDEEKEAALRRSVTEATARGLRGIPDEQDGKDEETTPPPLDVFLSHAKRDGTVIAERLRDGVRAFGQLVAWYDANDLPFGVAWESPMTQAMKKNTAAMVATVMDAYPTRPWCRREAKLARTPRLVDGSSQVWTVQPVVAVHQPGSDWVRSLPMLTDVPRIGWDGTAPEKDTARVVDRLVLEMLLTHTNRRVALALETKLNAAAICFITWVPDAWSLIMLWEALRKKGKIVEQVVYPGYGLSSAEVDELQPALHAFGTEIELVTYEKAWQDDPGGYTMSDPSRIVLSAGGAAEELAEHALGMEHVDELMVRLSRKLLQGGSQLAYGGILGDSKAQLTERLIDAALGWLRKESAKKCEITTPESWPLVNYAAWPYHTFVSLERRAELVGVCRFVDVPPLPATADELKRLQEIWQTDRQARRYTADSLTRMREKSTRETDLRIVWGARFVVPQAGWPGLPRRCCSHSNRENRP